MPNTSGLSTAELASAKVKTPSILARSAEMFARKAVTDEHIAFTMNDLQDRDHDSYMTSILKALYRKASICM